MSLKLKAAARLLPHTLCLLLLLCVPAARAATVGSEEALRRCREQFGPAIDAERNLFEVNRWYVLEAKFDRRGRLRELKVGPKYFYEESHPEWTEPESPILEGYWARYLTRYDYEKLLQRLDRIEPKGRLLKKDIPSVVTNMTEPVRDIYERAELIKGVVIDLRRGQYVPTLFKYVRLRYLGRAELRMAARPGLRLSKGINLKPFRKVLTDDQRR